MVVGVAIGDVIGSVCGAVVIVGGTGVVVVGVVDGALVGSKVIGDVVGIIGVIVGAGRNSIGIISVVDELDGIFVGVDVEIEFIGICVGIFVGDFVGRIVGGSGTFGGSVDGIKKKLYVYFII
jgi:hypothetical protein